MYTVKNDTIRGEHDIEVYVTDSYTAAVKVAEMQNRRHDVLITAIWYKGQFLETVWTGWFE